MSGKRQYWGIICKTDIYGPFRNDLEAAHYLLRDHTGGLLESCENKLHTKHHMIREMKK